MTTIATDGWSMAGDSLVTGNGIIHSRSFPKVRRLKDGTIAGFCGTVYGVTTAIAFLEGGVETLSLGDDFEAILLRPDGACEAMNGNGHRYEQSVPCVAGSGGAAALAAMIAGKLPEEAVAIACQVDMASGGAITVEHLKPELVQVA